MEGPGQVNNNEDHIYIQIERLVNGALLSGSRTKCSIFKVQEKFHIINDSAYSPAIVSIGPLHRGKPSLQEMEQTKLIFINEGLKRKEGNKEMWLGILRICTEFVESREQDARNYYSETTITIVTKDFVQMMVIDGLFIIALFLRRADHPVVGEYMNDPLLGKIADWASLTRDLLLLENQIPMFVLTGLLVKLGISERDEEAEAYIKQLTMVFFNYVTPGEIDDSKEYSEPLECGRKHLLDFVAKTFYLSPKTEEVVVAVDSSFLDVVANTFCLSRENKKVDVDNSFVTPNATMMKRSGIKFKRGSTKDSFLRIKFDYKKGVLEIPPLDIGDVTETLFRNLIAREQCSDGEFTQMSAYASFMDSLIDSPQDVRILISDRIIQSHLGSDEDVSNLFNKLCCDVAIPHDFYLGTRKNLYKYCNEPTKIWRATLKRDYCNNPFTTTSIVAATALLLFTLTQTIFTVIPVAIGGNDHQTRPPGP